MSHVTALPGLKASSYEPHALHSEERHWVEKNCYIDVFIGLLHALDLEPLAILGFCAGVDFEGDNFTFFKPSHDELRDLYGVHVQELNVWRPLLDHTVEHLGSGKFLSMEVDSFHLPDTAGTDYRRNHVKTTIVVAEVDPHARRIGYFHSAGYHELEGDDFDAIFRLDGRTDPAALPLFAELIRVDRLVRRPEQVVASVARGFLVDHVRWRPTVNPIERFQARFERDLPWLQERGLEHYHAWAFATVRQLGAASELLSLHLAWLADATGETAFRDAGADFHEVSDSAKTFILKAARAVTRRKPMDAADAFGGMSRAWGRGMDTLVATLG